MQIGTYLSPYLLYSRYSGLLNPSHLEDALQVAERLSAGGTSHHLVLDLRDSAVNTLDVALLAPPIEAAYQRSSYLGCTLLVASGCRLAPMFQQLHHNTAAQVRSFDLLEDALLYLCVTDRRLPPLLPFHSTKLRPLSRRSAS